MFRPELVNQYAIITVMFGMAILYFFVWMFNHAQADKETVQEREQAMDQIRAKRRH